MFVTKNSQKDIFVIKLEKGKENVEHGLDGIGKDIIVGKIGFIVNVINQGELLGKIINGPDGFGIDTIIIFVGILD